MNAGDLQMHSAAISFLSPSAFAYYLPAFMLAALEEPGVRSSLLERLAPPKDEPARPSYASWWELLSATQQGAVIQFVEHCQSLGESFSPAALAAMGKLMAANTSLERTGEE